MSQRRTIPDSPWKSTRRDLPLSRANVSNDFAFMNSSNSSSYLAGDSHEKTYGCAPASITGLGASFDHTQSITNSDPRDNGQYYCNNLDTSEHHPARSASIWSVEPIFVLPSNLYGDSESEYGELMDQSRLKNRHHSWDTTRSSTWNSPVLNHPLHNGNVSTRSYTTTGKEQHKRKPSNRDEFDGPHQLLQISSKIPTSSSENELPCLATSLRINEQDNVLSQVNDRLSKCAFDFVARYQFPIPIESDKRPVNTSIDREWTEWVYLLKRLATKRRIPARVLYNGQIKQFITILENSLEMRHAAKHQLRPLKDDRNVLQLISAGLQVAKILKDADAMDDLDRLYVKTEKLIGFRRNNSGPLSF